MGGYESGCGCEYGAPTLPSHTQSPQPAASPAVSPTLSPHVPANSKGGRPKRRRGKIGSHGAGSGTGRSKADEKAKAGASDVAELGLDTYVLGLVWATPLTAIITQSALLQSGRRWRLDLGLIWSPVAGALIYAGSTLSVRLCRYSGAPGSVGKFPSDAKETSKRSSRPGPAHHAVSKSSRLRSHSQDGECRKHTLCGAAPTRQPPRHIPSEG